MVEEVLPFFCLTCTDGREPEEELDLEELDRGLEEELHGAGSGGDAGG